MGSTKSGLRKTQYLTISLQKNSYFISEPITGTVTLYYKEYLHISDINVSLNMI